MPVDTSQQKAILRQCRAAQTVRKRFPAGTRIEVMISGWRGTVTRHVPGANAQGGYLVVKWDRNDEIGRVSPSQVRAMISG